MDCDNLALAASVKIAAFYKFVDIDEPESLQRDLREICVRHAVKGTIVLAREGINATISGTPDSIFSVLDALRADARFSDLAIKFSDAGVHPFLRLKVKVKREIVTFGIATAQPCVSTGQFVEPESWNELISEPGVLILDTRNAYEVDVGTFEGAQNPGTRAFNEFPDFVNRALAGDKTRKIAMFCTGGIRCEKASAYLLSEGFTNVLQLSGGILNYLECVAQPESLWRGECFVFDERVALEHGVRPGHYDLCTSCGCPIRRNYDDTHSLSCASCCGAKATPPMQTLGDDD